MSTNDIIAQEMKDAQALDDCHCCDVPADAPIFNRPGLSALAYRVGTYTTFFEAMKAQLSLAQAPTAGGRPLAALTTRDLDDPAIALLDAAAVLGDILSFYQERIANEGFLRTAVERRSVLELAREIGYELNPGVAASTYLAFIVEAPLVPSAALPMPSQIPIVAGQKVQSVPGPGQQPQTFETVAPIIAHVAWNEMHARTTQRQELAVVGGALYRIDPQSHQAFYAQALWLAGTATNIRIGDLLYVSVENSWAQDPASGLKHGIACVFVSNVEIDYQLGYTRVDLDQPSDAGPAFSMPAQSKGVVSLAPLDLTFANVRDAIVGRDWDEVDLRAYVAIQKWDEDEVLKYVATAVATAPAAAEVFVFRQKTAMAGNNAPSSATVDAQYTAQGIDNPWGSQGGWDNPQNDIYGYSDHDPKIWFDYFSVDIFLDRVIALRAGTLIALGNATVQPPRPFVIAGVIDASLVAFGMSARSTGLQLANPWTDPSPFVPYDSYLWSLKMRDTTAYVQSEKVALTEAPIDETVGGGSQDQTTIVLDHMILGLDPGQKLALTGVVAVSSEVPSGVVVTELCELARAVHSRGYTILHLAQALQHTYVRSSIKVNGNVASATHGETVMNEILGSGDASQKNQTFQLNRVPLTYVPAPTASGGEDTLTVRVDGVAWQEVPTLYGAGAHDTVFTVRHNDDGSTVLRFGDGNVGARLPTGANNVVATYRSGLGPAANLAAGAVAILTSRPYGLKSGVNPVDAGGGAAAEVLADARINAPRTVRTLERVVSLGDFSDFARGFAGISKAQAVPLWSGESQVVHITVAGIGGAPLDPNGAPWANLVTGMTSAGDAAHPIKIANFLPAYFKLTANIVIDPRYEVAAVLAQVTAGLTQAFSFSSRELARIVTQAEVIVVVQSIPGVIAIEVIELYRTDGSPGVGSTLPAHGAHFNNGYIVPAELLLLHPIGLALVGAHP